MKSLYQLVFAAIAFTLPLASCSDDDDYTPGEPEPAGSPAAYFPTQDAYSYTFTTDDENKSFDIVVKRLYAEAAVSVPVTLTSDVEGFTGAPTIEFAAGQETATYSVDCAGIPLQQECSVEISLPDDYAAIYAEGTSSVSVKSLVADWELWAPDVEFVFSSTFSPVRGNIYAMKGTRRLKFENFLNSGWDLEMEVEDRGTGSYYAILYPLNYHSYYIDYWGESNGYDCWYFYDPKTDYWPSWSPDNSDLMIDYALCYEYDDTPYRYTYLYIDKETPNNNVGSFTFSFDYSNGTSDWNYVNFSCGETLFEMF